MHDSMSRTAFIRTAFMIRHSFTTRHESSAKEWRCDMESYKCHELYTSSQFHEPNESCTHRNFTNTVRDICMIPCHALYSCTTLAALSHATRTNSICRLNCTNSIRHLRITNSIARTQLHELNCTNSLRHLYFNESSTHHELNKSFQFQELNESSTHPKLNTSFLLHELNESPTYHELDIININNSIHERSVE